MKKILSIIIIGFLLGCSFGVQGLFFEKSTEKTTTTDFGDIIFDKNLDVFMKLANFPFFSYNIDDIQDIRGLNERGNISDLSGTGIKLPFSVDFSNNEFPEYFNWRDHEGKDWTTPVRQQLSGDCGVFSALGALESIVKIRENCDDINPDLSEQYVLSCLPVAANEYGKGCTYGVLPSNAYKYIMSTTEEGNYHNGVCWESCFPYQARDFSQGVTFEQISSDWLKYLVPISDFGSIWNEGVIENTPESIEIIKNMIMQHGPSVAGMSITSSFQKWGYTHHGSDEYFPFSGENWKDLLSHGVVIIGWKDNISIPNGGYWICKNSWGTNFGYNGIFNIEYGACFTGVLLEWVDYNPDDFYWNTTAILPEMYSGLINEEIIFDACESIGAENSAILSYQWDFGDGNTGYGVVTTHAYSEEGKYQVNLTIIDDYDAISITSTDIYISSEPFTINLYGGLLQASFIIHNPSNFTIKDIIYKVEPIDNAPLILGSYYLAGKITILPGKQTVNIGKPIFGFCTPTSFQITIGDISKTEQIIVIGPMIIVKK